MIGYKVVLRAYFTKDNKECFLPCCIENSGLVYMLHEETKPKRGWGPLCLFSDLEAAKNFTRNANIQRDWDSSELVVFRCEYIPSKKKEVKKIDDILTNTPTNPELQKVGDRTVITPLELLPYKTVLADSIILLREEK